MKKKDEDYVRKRVGEKDKDGCARILTRDDEPNFVKIIRADKVGAKRKREDLIRKRKRRNDMLNLEGPAEFIGSR